MYIKYALSTIKLKFINTLIIYDGFSEIGRENIVRLDANKNRVESQKNFAQQVESGEIIVN